MSEKIIKIGGASGYWGDADMAVPQLLAAGDLDYIVFDYLAEVTMSIMARARSKDPSAGYATDFLQWAMLPNLQEIATQGVKIISNAGGVNPRACAEKLKEAINAAGLDLKVAVVEGDDLLSEVEKIKAQNPMEMFSGDTFPEIEKVASMNAYIGAFPIAAALNHGADIVITGRCVDSAVTLGACIHEFGWGTDEYDKLAGGSLAGHIIECGTQATGGNYTDWQTVADTLFEAGYPIAEIRKDGSFVTTKPSGTGGTVTKGTVGEQMLYEIGNPQEYILPDVICDFSEVTLEQIDEDRVLVANAKGTGAPSLYKVSTTYADGWRTGLVMFYYGEDAVKRAEFFAESSIKRARERLRSLNAPDYDETFVEIMGCESQYGAFGNAQDAREVAVKIAAKHQNKLAVGLLLKEVTGHALAAPPGLTSFSGARPKPSPIIRLFSFLLPKDQVPIAVELDGKDVSFSEAPGEASVAVSLHEGPELTSDDELVDVPLVKLAYARSGDKGDKANIGILPREKAYAPYIWSGLTLDVIKRRFAHFLQGEAERFYLPGTGAMNILLHDALGGGGIASLRNDPQGKGYSQIVLDISVKVPAKLATQLEG